MTNGVAICQQAFMMLQAHHDYCEHDTLSHTMEDLIHDYEDYCISCSVPRAYIPDRPICPKVDCNDLNPAILAYKDLNATCEAEVAWKEWAGIFPLSDATHTWIMQ